MEQPPRTLEPEGSQRYGIVLVVAIVLVLFLVFAPSGSGSRGVALLLTGCMLLVVVVTSRGDRLLREGAGVGLIAGTVALAVAVMLEWVPQSLGSIAAALLVLTTLVQLVRGQVGQLRTRGVTVQAVAGALAVYLLIGLAFAFAIGTAAKIGDRPYFAQGVDGTESQQVYFSFTSMTTTGFGDLTPTTRTGRGIAVMEMLVGQIYLVTVIALLVGNLHRRGPTPAD